MELKLKKSIIFIISAVMSLIFIPAVSAEDYQAVDITVNGHYIEGGRLIGDTTFVPLRAFINAAGYGNISWDDQRDTALISGDNLKIEVYNNCGYIFVNGRYFYNEKASYIENGVMFVSLRTISKAYSGEVAWSENDDGIHSADVITYGPAEHSDNFYNQDELYWMSRIISAESRGEPLIGQIAVGNVVLNRVESELFPDSIYEVIFDNKYAVQFSPTVNGAINKTPSAESVIAAKICLEGYSVSDDIIYFLNEKIATNTWIQKNRDYSMTIGHHNFYS